MNVTPKPFYIIAIVTHNDKTICEPLESIVSCENMKGDEVYHPKEKPVRKQIKRSE